MVLFEQVCEAGLAKELHCSSYSNEVGVANLPMVSTPAGETYTEIYKCRFEKGPKAMLPAQGINKAAQENIRLAILGFQVSVRNQKRCENISNSPLLLFLVQNTVENGECTQMEMFLKSPH